MPRGSDDETLDGAVAIVTGAAGGIGGEVVAQLRAAGAKVVAEDIDPAVEQLADDGIAALCADAAEADTARRAVDLALTRFGRLDVVVNNAGRFLLKRIVETTDDEWDGLMTTNVRSVFVHCRGGAAAPHRARRRRDRQRLVDLGRRSGSRRRAPTARPRARSPRSRGSWRSSTPPTACASTPSPPARSTPRSSTPPWPARPDRAGRARRTSARRTRSGAWRSPGEIARIMVFLASPASSFMTGAVVMADGGFTAQ